LRRVGNAYRATIHVRDNGVGIAPELLPRVFDLFVQGERTHEHPQGGLGIGLALVRKLVEMHGGSVFATSDGAGKGSEFVVRLPVATDAEPAAATAVPSPMVARAAEASPAAAPGGKRVLVIEDHEDSRVGLALWLEVVGHTVEASGDGLSALAVARARPPAIAIIDIGLPGLSGWEVAKRLREAFGRRIGLIALTSLQSAADHFGLILWRNIATLDPALPVACGFVQKTITQGRERLFHRHAPAQH